MKCKFCDGSGKDYWGRNGEPYPCPVCNGTGEYEPFDADIELDKLYPTEQTNEEWFCSLSTEEKVNALLNLHEKVRQRMRTDIGGENSFYRGDYYREWLKDKHHTNQFREVRKMV